MKEKEFKIALFMLPLLTQGGGAEKYFIELARNLRERGIEADVVTMDENFFRKFARLLHIFTRGNFFGKVDTGGRESEKDVLARLKKARWIKVDCKNLRKTLREYDLVYAKNELADLALLKTKGFKNIPPVIVGVHTPIIFPKTKSLSSKIHNWLYSSFIYRWLLRGVKCVHVSNLSAKNFVDKKLKLKSELVYYPFSAREIQERAQKEKCDIEFDAGKKNIIFAGRLSEQKGIDVLVNIIRKIRDSENLAENISINIFGSGDKSWEKAVEKIAEENSFVRCFGHIEHKFMPHILSQQDIMIAPYKWETLPYVILEAQAMGVPVIAFDIPGPSDIIEKDKTGFLAGSKEEFFEKLKDIIEEKVSFSRNAIIQNIEKKFNPEKIYSELISMFQENL